MIPVELVDRADGGTFGWRAYPEVPRAGEGIVIPGTVAERWVVETVTWDPEGTIPAVPGLRRAGVLPGPGLVVRLDIRAAPAGAAEHRRGWVVEDDGGALIVAVDRDLDVYPDVGTEVRW